jgi:hypothetical protein
MTQVELTTSQLKCMQFVYCKCFANKLRNGDMICCLISDVVVCLSEVEMK